MQNKNHKYKEKASREHWGKITGFNRRNQQSMRGAEVFKYLG